MTERTIRSTAKSLAGAFYEDEVKGGENKAKSARFRAFWPNVAVFQARNWPSFVKMARELMVAQLNDKSTSEPMKMAIADALIEDRKREIESNAPSVKVGHGTHNLHPLHPGKMERKLFHE